MSCRRAVLGAALLAGCGFRPLHGPEGSVAAAELAAVRVGNIPDRFGQVLRRSLERRFGSGAQARYLLEASVSFNVDGIGFRRDGTATRQRFTASGAWALSTLSVPPERVAGSAIPVRAIDAYNVPDLQFFAAESGREAMELRLAETLAEEIGRQVALALRQIPLG